MGDRRRIDIGPLDSRERGQVAGAIRRLEAIPPGGPPTVLFDALRTCAPVIGGLVGVMGAEMSGSAISHVVGLPAEVLEGWAMTPLPHLHRMMAPLVSAAPGEVISDRAAITGRFREELRLLDVLRSAGLGETAGYRIATRTTLSGKLEHRFLTVALDGGATFTGRQRELFHLLQPAVAAALARMDVPIIPAERILPQIIEESRIGYLCLSTTGVLVELNERAQELIPRCLQAAKIEAGRGCLPRFAEQALLETSRGRAWHLLRPEAQAGAEITAHRLPNGVHHAGGELTLVMIREMATAPTPLLPADGLTPRQHNARLFVTSGLSYKEMADHFGIAEGTLRKHVEKVYRRFGVGSRAALAAKFRRAAPGMG